LTQRGSQHADSNTKEPLTKASLAATFILHPAAVMLACFQMGKWIRSPMKDDYNREATAAFIAASLRNLIRMTEAHKDLVFLGYLIETARAEAERQAG